MKTSGKCLCVCVCFMKQMLSCNEGALSIEMGPVSCTVYSVCGNRGHGYECNMCASAEGIWDMAQSNLLPRNLVSHGTVIQT